MAEAKFRKYKKLTWHEKKSFMNLQRIISGKKSAKKIGIWVFLLHKSSAYQGTKIIKSNNKINELIVDIGQRWPLFSDELN